MRIRLIIPLLAATLAACDDPFGPARWVAVPDTVVLYSASRPELLGLPSAYDFVNQGRFVIESLQATGGWDFVVTESGGEFLFVPASALPGLTSRAAIAPANAPTLEEIARAPTSEEFSTEPVPLIPGELYIVRTRTASCGGFGSGVFYGKFKVIDVDPATGRARIAAIRNPYCNNRDLIPED